MKAGNAQRDEGVPRGPGGPPHMCEYFSKDYVTARGRFRDAVKSTRGRLDAVEIEAKGPGGESLTIDIAWLGSVKPRHVFIHSSGLHGVEGFAGSAIQLQWLQKGIPRLPEDAAIVLVHVINPYGMAWLRRFNENNVDLNRNFLGSDEEFDGAPEGYRKLEKFLNPATEPSRDLFYLRAACLVARYGIAALRQAVAGGQYDYPKGLFFGGARLEEGPAKLQEYMAGRLAGAERIVVIDIHTGLGRFGDDQLLVDAGQQKDIHLALLSAYGEHVQPLDMSGIAYAVRGAQFNLYYRLRPRAQIYFATQEFGTYHSVRVVEALRAENRWHHYGGGGIDHRAKTRLQEVFNPIDEDWRRRILQRGHGVIQQGVTLTVGHDAHLS